MRVHSLGLALLAACTTLLVGPVSFADDAAFDRQAAAKAISGVDLSPCNAKQGTEGHVVITFDPHGKASKAVLDRGEFKAPVGKCLVGKFKKVTVPAFDGPAVIVGKTFHIE